MTYEDAMENLQNAVYEAVRAADDEDGAPVAALRELAAEIDCLVDTRCTRKEFAAHKALYKGVKMAGLT